MLIFTGMKRSIWFLFFTIFLDLLGVGILIPIVPLLFADPSSAYFLLSPGTNIDYGYILLGFLVASYPLSLFLTAPILGQLSDRFGRKKILIISITGTALSYLLFAYGVKEGSIPIIFISRVLDGLTGGNISVAQAAIADLTPNKDRAKNFGLIGAAFGLGFILGPFLGGVMSKPDIISWFSITTPFIFSSILSVINVLSLIFFFKETHQPDPTKNKIDFLVSFKKIISAKNYKDERIIFLSTFLMSCGFTFFTTFFGVYLITKYNFDQTQIGSFFGYVGLWIVITQGLITRFLAKYVSEVKVLRVVYFTSALAIFLYFFPEQAKALLYIVPAFAISNGLANANSMGLLSRKTRPDMQGEVLGINSSVMALGQTIPPVLSGFIAAILSPGAPLIISGIVIGVAGLAFVFLYEEGEEDGLDNI